MISKNEIEGILGRVSDKMMHLKNPGVKEKFPVSLIDMNCWEWPQGVGLFGLYKYYCKSQKQEVLDFLIRWFDERISEGISERNVNTTAPMLTLTYIYEITQKESYLELIRSWADWVMDENGLLRTKDGCFQHMITGDPNDGEILIDTLFMTILFLSRAGKLLNRPDYAEEADYQIVNHIKYLYNKEEGLFYHGWNFNHNNNYGKVLWGRGNSWYTVGMMEYLEERDIYPALKRHYLSVYRYQCQAIKRYQDKAKGLWHTVVNDESTYIEISAGAGFLAGMMKGVRLGYLEAEEYLLVISEGVKHILAYIQEDGTVDQVSYGTPIGMNVSFYQNVPCYPMTYGQALMILMLQEMMEDYWQNL